MLGRASKLSDVDYLLIHGTGDGRKGGRATGEDREREGGWEREGRREGGKEGGRLEQKQVKTGKAPCFMTWPVSPLQTMSTSNTLLILSRH